MASTYEQRALLAQLRAEGNIDEQAYQRMLATLAPPAPGDDLVGVSIPPPPRFVPSAFVPPPPPPVEEGWEVVTNMGRREQALAGLLAHRPDRARPFPPLPSPSIRDRSLIDLTCPVSSIAIQAALERRGIYVSPFQQKRSELAAALRRRPDHTEVDAMLHVRGIARTEDHSERKRDALQAAAFRLQQNLAARPPRGELERRGLFYDDHGEFADRKRALLERLHMRSAPPPAAPPVRPRGPTITKKEYRAAAKGKQQTATPPPAAARRYRRNSITSSEKKRRKPVEILRNAFV